MLGIDPGSRTTGYGVIERTVRGIRYVECGIITPRPQDGLGTRLVEIFEDLCRLIDELSPDVAAIENIFHRMHPRAALTLGHARGVAMLAAARAELRVFEY